MKVPKLLAAGLIAAGLVIGGSTVAHATTASPYVTVAWSFDAYPDLTAPQPYVASTPGADLHAFDALAGSPAWCGKPLQVDVYKLTDEHGRSWETLKETGALLYAHDGGFLAYDAGVGTPYRVIYPEEIQCTIPTTPATPEPSSTPTFSPEPSETPTPTPSSTPTSEPTSSPSSTTPVPSETSAPSPTPTATTPVLPPTGEPTPTGTHQPTATATPSTPSSAPKSKPSASASATPAPSPTSTDQLAYTGANPWPGIGAASVLILAGLVLLIARRVRRG